MYHHMYHHRHAPFSLQVKFPYTLNNGSFGWYDEGGPVTGLSNGTEGGKVRRPLSRIFP